jgi:putative CocE/NonD family hydrolase
MSEVTDLKQCKRSMNSVLDGDQNGGEVRATMRQREELILSERTSMSSAAPKVEHMSRKNQHAASRIRWRMDRAALWAIGMLFFSSAGHAADPYPVTYERNVVVSMRDGVTLRADVYRPEGPGKFPVLLQRTPYDKNYGTAFGIKAAARGYVVIIEDVRGRFASNGEWYPFKNESTDGYDTVEWAAALPYSSGKVGMFGASYVGATQMLAAIVHPPHLAGICPIITGSNYHSNWTYQGGAFEQWFNESWTSLALAPDTFNRIVVKNTNVVNGTRSLPLRDYSLFEFQQLPSPSTSTPALAPYFLDWLDHPSYDDYWKRVSIEEHFSDIMVPALHVAAWYDIFLGGSLRNYLGIKGHGGSEDARRGQRLLVIVGGHAGAGPKVGAVDFGAASKVDEDEVTLHWYDYLFKGTQNEFASGKLVNIFVLGRNQWRQEAEWPLARARSTPYFLHSAGAANGLAGNGSLSILAPAAEKPDQYTYDPNDPVPTIGGPLCCDALPTGIGPEDQRPAEARGDVLVYTTPAFAKDTEVTGPVSLDLYVSSSAVDTDFTGMLVDVWPNGFAQNLTSGILRLRYRNSQETPELANPWEKYHITLDLWAVSNVFLAGHKLRLEVSSSNFPRFDRNLNTGDEPSQAARTAKATNIIFHDKAHPSALIVPVVP